MRVTANRALREMRVAGSERRLLRLPAPPLANAAVRLARAGTPIAIVGLRKALPVATFAAVVIEQAALARPSLWDRWLWSPTTGRTVPMRQIRSSTSSSTLTLYRPAP
jgi:hypothetical protein